AMRGGLLETEYNGYACVPATVILRCEPGGATASPGEPRRMHALQLQRGRRPSRLAARAPQGDGFSQELVSSLADDAQTQLIPPQPRKLHCRVPLRDGSVRRAPS